MYRVLLVDDEPIILAGIKFMIDWQKNECELVGTARNGRQALEAIEKLRPDIVVADINMPVMNGIELLKLAKEAAPNVVFLMLTNLQEFDLAREALRYQAVEYMTKTNLEAETLEEALRAAKKEAAKRNALARVDQVDDYLRTSRQEMLENSVNRLLNRGVLTDESVEMLQAEGVLKRYAALQIWLLRPQEENTGGVEQAEQSNLLGWGKEMIQKLAENFCHNFLLVETRHPQKLVLLNWGSHLQDKGAYFEQVAEFAEKLSNMAIKIAGLQTNVLASEIYQGVEQREKFAEELAGSGEFFYLYAPSFILPSQIPAMEFQPLELAGVGGRLKVEITAKNLAACLALLDKTAGRIEQVEHERAQALWQCGDLYSSACKVLPEVAKLSPAQTFFTNTKQGYKEIELLCTRTEVLGWLEKMRAELEGVLAPLTADRSDLIEKAKQYAIDNVENRILLQDAADHICISPGYLSALFKKEYGQNFVDFVNQTKMERACELILEGKLRMNEISYQLSFENAYYFSKVFKKHIGMTPTEYRWKMKKEKGAPLE